MQVEKRLDKRYDPSDIFEGVAWAAGCAEMPARNEWNGASCPIKNIACRRAAHTTNFSSLSIGMTEYDRLFPFLERLDEGARHLFAQNVVRITLPAGKFICMQGDLCGQVPLLMSGSVRVYKTSDTGREITLYRIEPGESCILTASCILSRAPFPAFAVSEEPVQAAVIPSATFAEWVNRYGAWREFVFSLLSKRFASVIEVVEEVAFRRLDSRVAAYLLEALDPKNEVKITHEKIALDLGSSREVISRLLREFEREGLVRRSRGRILIQQIERLKERV